MTRPTNKSVSQRPFVYGLQRVRDLRALEEDRAKEALALSMALRLRGESMLRAASERLADAHAAAGSQDVTSAASLHARQAWTERLERSHSDAVRELAGHDALVAARRAEVADKGRAREVLDRLRNRKLAEHKVAETRREGALLDEIALGMHTRRRVA